MLPIYKFMIDLTLWFIFIYLFMFCFLLCSCLTAVNTHVLMCLTWSRPFLSSVSSCCTSPAWLVAFATSHRSRSLSASSCSMCCCFSFRASCSAVVPEILRAYRADVSVSWKDANIFLLSDTRTFKFLFKYIWCWRLVADQPNF